MRRFVTPVSLCVALWGGYVAAAAGAAEVTRTLKLELSAEDAAKPFAVENLTGSLGVSRGSSDKVVATVTVHAESDTLADLVRFEQVVDKGGRTTLRVRYPLDKYRTLRAPRAEREGSGHSWLGFLGLDGSSRIDYDGHRVTVSGSDGVWLYADVAVELPARDVDAELRQAVGAVHAGGVSGKLSFESGSGDVTVADARGEIKAETGSGDIQGSHLEGSFRCSTGSGSCDITGFKGDALRGDTGSGNIRLSDVEARVVKADTGSGDIQATDILSEDFDADTGSGDVTLIAREGRLTRVKVDTGSGDVKLRLGANASFEAYADQGSGDLVSHYADAQPIVKKKEVVGYRRGDGKIHIDVDTGSGDVVLEPGS